MESSNSDLLASNDLLLAQTLSLTSGQSSFYDGLTSTSSVGELPTDPQVQALMDGEVLPFSGTSFSNDFADDTVNLFDISASSAISPLARTISPIRTIRGTNGRDSINTSRRAGRFRIFGLRGNDQITVRSRSVAYGDIGNDILNATRGTGLNTLLGGAGNDTLYARSRDRLFGGDGRDQLFAGLSQNRLTGGLGADRFWIANGRFPTGLNTITDFNRAQDRLVIRNLPGVFSFDDLTLVATGQNTRIQSGGKLIARVLNVQPNQLNSQHFIIGSLAAPTITADLQADTGVSSSDRVTREVALTGQVRGPRLASVAVRANGGAFTDITALLDTSGEFTLSRSQLDTLNGSPLPDGSHTVEVRATNAFQRVVTQAFTFTLDTTPVAAATLTAPAIILSGSEPYRFTVEYTDNTAIDSASLGDGDVRVTGPGGFSQVATWVSVDPASDGTPRTATYQIVAPGGTWDLSDNGTYAVELLANQVADTAGNLQATDLALGNFSVNLSNLPGVTLALADDTGISGSDRLTSNASLSGQISGNGLTQIQLSINGEDFVDFGEPLNITGNFSLSAAQLAAYTGSALTDGSYTVVIRATNPEGLAESTLTFTLDTLAATAIAAAPSVTTATATPTLFSFTVTYTDNTAIDVSSLGDGDVQVTGANGFSQAATLVGVDGGENGTPRTATYQVTVPGTTWNNVDNGVYTLTLVAGEVEDTAGNAIAPGAVGSFTVAIPLAPQRINFQPVTAPTPAGYTIDVGAGFDADRGYGWVIQGSNTAIDLGDRTFDRNATLNGAAVNQRLDTVIQMQTGGSAAAWEFALANGRYSVTVSVGDTAGGSNHLIRAEGLTLVPAFTAVAPQTFKLATLTVDVLDGRLTLDALGGTDTRLNFVEITAVSPGDHPSVITSPLANATNVNRRAAINLSDLTLVAAGEGVDATTLTAATVQLYRTRDNTLVVSNLNTSGGADTIIVQPTAALDANTQYTLRITDGVLDLGGRSFLPYSLTFTTGNEVTPPTDGVNFTQSVVFAGSPLASLTMSPDNQFLYATALDGQLRRWTVEADGSLSGLQTFAGLVGNPGAPRELIGITFDPINSNVIWVAQNTRTGSSESQDFTSKIVKVTLNGGTDFTGTVQDYVVGLPRSARDHFSNSLRFGPDGNLYLTQGSNTSAGVADIPWGLRPERLLSAAMLQIDPNLTPPAGGFNVQTENYTTTGGTLIPGNYDPFALGAPVKLYATGLRNSYDFVFHSNGTLYAPVNGSGGGGITPDDPNTPANESLSNVGSRPDFLFRIEEGRYYGHPNATRGEYIMAGGNPTAGNDPDQLTGVDGVSGYAVGVAPDPDYSAAILNLGSSRAPTGVIEYQSNTFGGRMQNRILFTEYSSGDDIVLLDLNQDGTVATSSILAGGSVNPDWGMANPVDLVENTANGHLYVAELYPQGFAPGTTPGRIRLLKPA